jgi:Na+-transporting NADH:ubiquinone oxidoreductase subunit NqrD
MIVKSQAAVADTLIAAACIVMGTILPGSLLDSTFQAHVGGIAIGIGVGWLVKSMIEHAKGAKHES